MSNSKTIVIAGALVIISIAVYATWSGQIKTHFSEQPSLEVTAIEVMATTMTDMISLNGVLKKDRNPYALLEADDVQAKKCKKGMEALVRVSGHPTSFTSKVSHIKKQKGKKYHVTVPLPSDLAGTADGTEIVASLASDSESSVLAVPWTAIVEQEGTCVWVLDYDDVPSLVPVELGAYDENIVGITGEVSAGNWVILSPPDELSESPELVIDRISY